MAILKCILPLAAAFAVAGAARAPRQLSDSGLGMQVSDEPALQEPLMQPFGMAEGLAVDPFNNDHEDKENMYKDEHWTGRKGAVYTTTNFNFNKKSYCKYHDQDMAREGWESIPPLSDAKYYEDDNTVDGLNVTITSDLSELCLLYTSPSPRD